MLFLNHALTGALLGVVVDEPLLLVPAALGSHYVLDALPHFGYPKVELHDRRWLLAGIADGALTVAVMAAACAVWPQHAVRMVLGATIAVLPDLFYVPHVLFGRRLDHWWHRLHQHIQWAERPAGFVVDAVWAGAMVYLLTRWA